MMIEAQLLNLPDNKQESYKYTNLRQKLVNLNVSAQKIEPVFSGADITPIFKNNTWHITISDDQIINDPLFISWNVPAGSYTQPNLEIHLEAGSSLTLIEHLEGAHNAWCNRAAKIDMAAGAKLTHITSRAGQGVVTEQTDVQVHANGGYYLTNLATGFDTARHDLNIDLRGQGAQTVIKSATLLRGVQHGDLTAIVRHLAPLTSSSQTIHTVLDDTARGVYQGKIYVDRLAQKTDGYQLSNAMLLNAGTEMDSKPELEIYADDVKCSHGATTGNLDDDQLFYLMSRGLPEHQARAMLLNAFVTTLFDLLPDMMKLDFDQKIQTWLGVTHETR